LSVPPFTRAFMKSPSSRGLSAIAELLVIIFVENKVVLLSIIKRHRHGIQHD